MVYELIRKMIEDSIDSKKSVYNKIDEIILASNLIISALKQGNKIFCVGNGGSAAQAQHFVAELVGRFEAERKAIPALSLTTDTSNLTAIGNDYGFNTVFKRQLEALGNGGDVLICLSTSGNSENIIRTIEIAKLKNIKVINLLGKDGGKIKGTGDVDITIPIQNTARIQECHILILHILAKIIEDAFLNKNETPNT